MKINNQKLAKISNLLSLAWSKETCSPIKVDSWTDKNPSSGQCAISALVTQDYFGGDLAKIIVENVVHYFNVINDDIVDTTAAQFGDARIDYSNYKIKTRQDVLSNQDTKNRYQALKQKVRQIECELEKINQEIWAVDYNEMGERCLEEKMIWFGKDNEIVIVGEAPARNGWIKSGKAWYDLNNKKLPSGVILEKLLKKIDKNLLEVTFLEAIKCFPTDRKYLKKLSLLYRPTLIKQLKLLKPKLVLTMGDVPTRTLLGGSYKKLSDVVGEKFVVDNLVVVPFYHPSPISPKSYKGNLPVFEEIRRYLKLL